MAKVVSKSPGTTRRQLPSSCIVPVPLRVLPVSKLRSRGGLLPSNRKRAPDWISNSPLTFRLLPAVTIKKLLVLNNSLPPAGTLIGICTTDSEQQLVGSLKTSHK